ncbi:30S ribosomal protein S4e [Candidatus Nitrosocosmicus franklandus]|uniref:Small ribosomal subunit protein eS4 n=1 Tax=Candidatus Nitrosocosmicus franklandianus TaxID=1798806 RepID=A0A484IDM7_9ARCH|nr:30S ribosomal protein S4e [Candidatus Nitrosocosmicus franklandus]VFJ15486.1 30S ribosomal protein S4e [Candidatus Nitrosocosmicus franklandus]
MVRKSGSTKLKRQKAPNFWDVRRKSSQFILSPRPGPYPKSKCYPLGILLRDVLHLSSTANETKQILNSGQIKVDGIVRRDIRFGVGIMDVIEISSSNKAYRLIPKGSELLVPVETNEKKSKLLKITSKTTISGGKIQYGFHDGKSLIGDDVDMKVGDVCLVTIPELKIDKHIKFETGCLAIVVQGENAGKIGRVEEIKDGMFSLPKRVVVTFDEKTVELPVELIMPIGVEDPVLEVLAIE